MKKYKTVLITGASSGIGQALAIEYAQRGTSVLFLCGRNHERLQGVVEACQAHGSIVHATTLDISDAPAVRAWIEVCHSQSPLNLVIANAGIGTTEETEENVRRMFDTNVGGVLNTVFPALDCYARRKAEDASAHCQIALVSSMTGYHGLPQCPSYSASKACVKAWGAGLRGAYAKAGITINVICPGFVRSRITDRNTCPMPFFMEAEKAAHVIYERLNRNVGLITFPWPMRFLMWIISTMPDCISMALFSKLPEKN